MKKVISIVMMFFLMAFCLTSCKDTKNENSPAPTDLKITDADLCVEIKGTKISILDDVTKLTAILGDNYEYEESVSCTYDGFDKSYDYGDIYVITVPPAGKDIICDLQVKGGDYKTARGISIGSTFEEVVAAYGEGYTSAGDIISYWKGEQDPKTPKIYFSIVDNKVAYFSVYAANNI